MPQPRPDGTFSLLLASRAALLQQQQDRQRASPPRQSRPFNNWPRRRAKPEPDERTRADTETQGGAPGSSGAALPSVAGNTDFGSDSVAITGQTGQVSPMAGMDMDRVRDAIEDPARPKRRSDPGGWPVRRTASAAELGGGFWWRRRWFRGGGGFGGGGGGFGGGGRGNFRGFNPGQPHGAIFWIGSNSALNAEPFALNGQPQVQPATGTNRFGLTFMSAPYIPHLTKPSGKDTFFLTLSGTRSSNPLDDYATVPTTAERAGDFSASGLPPIYDPNTGLQFQDPITGKLNVIPATASRPRQPRSSAPRRAHPAQPARLTSPSPTSPAAPRPTATITTC